MKHALSARRWWGEGNKKRATNQRLGDWVFTLFRFCPPYRVDAHSCGSSETTNTSTVFRFFRHIRNKQGVCVNLLFSVWSTCETRRRRRRRRVATSQRGGGAVEAKQTGQRTNTLGDRQKDVCPCNRVASANQLELGSCTNAHTHTCSPPPPERNRTSAVPSIVTMKKHFFARRVGLRLQRMICTKSRIAFLHTSTVIRHCLLLSQVLYCVY